MSNSKIEWTEKTWNPVTGCTKVSAGCQNCYAEVMSRRLKGMGQTKYQNGFNVTLHPECLDEPVKEKKPSVFFVCSMSDLFHKDVPFEFIDKVMETIEKCPQHTFQLLTKRPERMNEYFNKHRRYNVPQNTWLGTTVEYGEAVKRLFTFTGIVGARVKFLSCEPLVGDLGNIGLDLSCVDWVIVGGESGPNARPMKKEWVLNIKRMCEEKNVPFFFKQWGTYGEDGVKRNKKANGSMLDGKYYKEYPKEIEEKFA